MTQEEKDKLIQAFERIEHHFDVNPYSANLTSLKDDFTLNDLDKEGSLYYSESVETIGEYYHAACAIYIYSLLNEVCKKEEKLYYFDTPYQAGMRYDAVMKKENAFYLLDEDGHFRDVFSSEKFMQFVQQQHSMWKK
ncbi:MAG: hypothetical protein LBR17_05940 [Bacteroidales bacterium]|jgi:hypothetical protein|nr:hypothetical protein [Bacteroidales bacterium]